MESQSTSTSAPDGTTLDGTTPGDPAEVDGAAKQPTSRWQSLWREWIRPSLLIALVMFSFRSAVADWNDVPTGSMKPTILEGDRIFINKVAYDLKFPFTTWRLAEWSNPHWGDVVVLRSPEDGKRLVKRVVGLPGDIIEVRGRRLWVNGEAASYLQLDEGVVDQIEEDLRPHYIFANEKFDERRHAVMLNAASPAMPFGPFQVPEGNYFVMGDNRSNSRDSRWFGPVPRTLILGQATAVALSFDPKKRYKPRLDRFFSKMD